MIDTGAIGILSGAALLGAAGLRAARGVQSLRRRGEREGEKTETRRASFANQLDAAMHLARASRPTHRAWNGTRPFRVSSVVDEAEGYRSFYLAPEDGRPLPRFEPGQYLTFHLPTADPMRPLVRCYSLSDRPREDYYRVTIKRLDRGADGPGRGSGYFHSHIGPGSVLAVEAPQGAFFLDPTDRMPVVLVSGGVGVTPLLSMAAALVHRRDRRPIHFFAGFRSGREHPFRVELADLAKRADNLRVAVSYSQPLEGDRLGRDFHQRGHVDAAKLRSALPSNNFRFFVCGPPAMMESLVPELLAWGMPAEHIHYEAFGPASVRSVGGDAGASSPCDVQFARSAKSLRWTGEANSLLELAEQGGLPLESGCRAGSCGQCRVMISAGRVRHAKRPGVELVDGECLACIARPDGDIVVDA